MSSFKALAFGSLLLISAGVLAACGAATPTPDCLAVQNGQVIPAGCQVPGVTLQPTATPPPTTPTSGGGGGPAPSGPAAHGQQLALVNGCSACHSTDGSSGIGPTWKGLYGSKVSLADGSTVTADDAYIHESIVDPNAKIVKGFQPNIMPHGFGDKLSDQDISDIIAYMKTLK